MDRQEWLTKLQAIIDLCNEGIDLFVVARTDARSAVSLDEAIARAIAARDLGVDAIVIEAPESVAELERVSREVGGVARAANMIEGGRTPLLSPQELHELGYDLIATPLGALLIQPFPPESGPVAPAFGQPGRRSAVHAGRSLSPVGARRRLAGAQRLSETPQPTRAAA